MSILLAFWVAALLVQSPPTAAVESDRLTLELAARIVGAIAPATQISLTAGADVTVPPGLSEHLRALGIGVVGAADGVPSARVTCLDNLRERVCTAEIAGGRLDAVVVTRAHERPRPAGPLVGLEMRPVISSDGPILDIVRRDDDLFVLTPTEVLRYERRDEREWRPEAAGQVRSTRPWPRDLRGRLHVVAGRVEAFLPGISCSGPADSLALTCGEANASWPLTVDGAGMDPSRNYFTLPNGASYFGFARLSGDGGAPWIAATRDRRIVLLTEDLQEVATAVSGVEVAALRVPCLTGSVVVASPDARGDTVTLFQAVVQRLAPAAAPLPLPGELMALWPAASNDVVTAVTRERETGRYVAHELTASCSR